MLKTNRDIIITDWKDLQERIFTDAYDKNIRCYRSPYVFRGMHNKAYELNTSLSRLGHNPLDMEKNLFRNFKKYAPRNTFMEMEDNDWIWLSLAQHHGLPTRLIDWTFSPYIALHFMCEDMNQYDADGVLWCIDFYKTKEFLPQKFKRALEDESAKGFDISILKSVCPTLRDLNDYMNADSFIVFFEPPSMDDRIVNQFAIFSFMSDPNVLMNDWLNEHEELYFRLVIPAQLKWEIRDKLDQINITERIIYPGLDGLSKWLKRWYSKL